MAEALVADGLVHGCHPFLGAPALAEFCEAADGDVAAAGGLRGRAVARFPADVDQAGTPRVAEPALLRYDRQAYLRHA